MVLLPVVIEPLSLAGQIRCFAAAQRMALRFYEETGHIKRVSPFMALSGDWLQQVL
jgi:hypothetical protein